MAENKLRRSTGNKILGGLCGGLGEYFNIDPTIIRLVWILAIFWIGIPAIAAYLVGLIVISVSEPKNELVTGEEITGDPEITVDRIEPPKTGYIWGWLIIGVGVLILLENLDFLKRAKEYLFPVALIGAGVWVLMHGFQRTGNRQ